MITFSFRLLIFTVSFQLVKSAAKFFSLKKNMIVSIAKSFVYDIKKPLDYY